MERRTFITSALAGAAAATSLGASRSAAAAQERSEPRFKLKYAPHLGMFRHHAESDVGQIEFMAAQSFRALEDNGMRGRPADEQARLAEAMEKHGIEMGVFVANDNGFDAGNPILASGRGDLRERFLQNIRDSVELAKRVRARYATVVPGTVDQRLDRGFQRANVVEALKRAAGICEPHGLVLVCEPLNWRDHPGLFLVRTDESYEIMKAVDSPSLKILFDIYHQQISEGNLIPNIERAWDEIAYFQIGDNPGRNEPGTGEINYRNVFRFIRQKGFRGIMGMEHGVAGEGREGEEALIQAYVEADTFQSAAP